MGRGHALNASIDAVLRACLDRLCVRDRLADGCRRAHGSSSSVPAPCLKRVLERFLLLLDVAGLAALGRGPVLVDGLVGAGLVDLLDDVLLVSGRSVPSGFPWSFCPMVRSWKRVLRGLSVPGEVPAKRPPAAIGVGARRRRTAGS